MKVVDPTTPEALADRPAFYNWMRENCPVARVENQGGDHFLVSGYDAVKQVLTDNEHFTKEWGSQLAPMERGIALNQDSPDFSAFKAMYNGYMSPNGVKRWRADAQRIANELVDRLDPMGSGDLQDLFGKPLPARVAAVALGFPEDPVDKYRKWTDSFLSAMIQDPAEQQRIIAEIYAFFDEQFDRMRGLLKAAGVTEPAPEHVGTVLPDCLTAVLMTSKFQDRYLTNDELRRTIRGFFIGGVDTTGALILNVLHELLKQGLWDKIVADPSLIPAAIEESLRYEPPTIGMFRGVKCPVSMAGETLPEGSRVLFSLYGANRDPSRFDDPDTFRLDRKMSSEGFHISFGSGDHFCPGAWTARMEAVSAIEILAKRLPKLRLTGPVTYFDVVNFYVVRTFPAAWD